MTPVFLFLCHTVKALQNSGDSSLSIYTVKSAIMSGLGGDGPVWSRSGQMVQVGDSRTDTLDVQVTYFFFSFFFSSSMKTVQWSAYLIADKCNSVMSGAAICTRCSFFSNCGIVVEQHTCPGYGKPSLGRPLSHGGSCNRTWWPRRSSLSWPCINLKAAFWCCHWIRTGEHQVTRARSIKGEKILYLLKWK